YSHLSAWPLVGLLWLLLLGAALRAGRWSLKAVSLATWIAFGVWAASLLPWAAVFVSALFTASSTFIDTYGDPTYSWRAMWRLPFVMNWGGGWLRAPVTILLLAAGVFGGLKNRSTRLAVALLLGMMVLLFGLLSMMMGAGKGLFSLRYYSPLWLLFMVLSGLGFRQAGDGWDAVRPSVLPRGVRGDAVLGLLLLGVTAMPLSWIIRLPGNPTPYTRINQWMDEHLPAGTPVIVDRWFEPNHEMRFHAPSRVRPTFTIPNEPLETFLQYNWRETVRRFVQRHPDAAYLEMIKSYFHVPVVGPWDWPRHHFARHMVFTNEPALALRRAVLAASEDYYAVNTNRVVVELFYNLKEDLVNQARADGRAVAAFYGEGWEFTKTQDYRDWRVLQERATVELYNLTGQPLDVRLVLIGAAPGRSKRVQNSLGATETFPPNQMQEWAMTVDALPPGRTEVVFTDALWTAAQVPLLVEELRAEVIAP
ncbi:MAG: hypothetical protein KKC51_14440, partial [Verrucomicrobia bacterium]|nr:hypothetical protein [Verrucomicrobiota bacterium]